MKRNNIIIVALAFAVIAGCTSNKTVEATDENNINNKEFIAGKNLHKNSCTKCHTTSVYTRKDRTVPNLASLKKRVQKCNVNTGASMNPQELENLSLFLNDSYYKFTK